MKRIFEVEIPDGRHCNYSCPFYRSEHFSLSYRCTAYNKALRGASKGRSLKCRACICSLILQEKDSYEKDTPY